MSEGRTPSVADMTAPNSAVAAPPKSAAAASLKSANPLFGAPAKSGKKQKKKKSNRKQKEQSRNYELVRRRRRESGEFCKAVLRFFFSNVGLILVAIFVAFVGAGKSTSMEEYVFVTSIRAGLKYVLLAES